MQKIEDEKWSWHLGLDSDSNNILNDLYHGLDVDEERLKQILCLFKLDAEQGFAEEMKGKPVYVGLAMNENCLLYTSPSPRD